MISRSVFSRLFNPRCYSLLGKVILLLFYAGLPRLLGEEVFFSGLKIRLSPLYNTGLSVRLRGSSYAALLARNKLAFTTVLTLPEVQYGYADREFFDGYVRQDPGTGNPASLVPDSTWFWGYDDTSQYDPLEQTLSFRRLSWGQQQESAIIRHSYPERSNERSSSAIGLEISADYPLLNSNFCQLGLQVGWLFIPGWDWQQQQCSYDESLTISNRQLEILETYQYDVEGISIPPAGHTGTYLGPFDTPPLVPSTIIPNRPSTIQQTPNGNSSVVDSNTYHYRNQVKYKFSCDSHELRLGPILRRQLFGEQLALTLVPAASLALLSVDGKRQETLLQDGRTAIASWRDHNHRHEFLAGLAVSCQLEYQCSSGWFLGAGLAYYWYPQEPSISLGPGKISLRANKFTLAATLGYKF